MGTWPPETWAVGDATVAHYNERIRDAFRDMWRTVDYKITAGSASYLTNLLTSDSFTFNGTDQVWVQFQGLEAHPGSGSAYGHRVYAELLWNGVSVGNIAEQVTQVVPTGGVPIGPMFGFLVFAPAAATATFQIRVNGTATTCSILGGRLHILRKDVG